MSHHDLTDAMRDFHITTQNVSLNRHNVGTQNSTAAAGQQVDDCAQATKLPVLQAEGSKLMVLVKQIWEAQPDTLALAQCYAQDVLAAHAKQISIRNGTGVYSSWIRWDPWQVLYVNLFGDVGPARVDVSADLVPVMDVYTDISYQEEDAPLSERALTFLQRMRMGHDQSIAYLTTNPASFDLGSLMWLTQSIVSSRLQWMDVAVFVRMLQIILCLPENNPMGSISNVLIAPDEFGRSDADFVQLRPSPGYYHRDSVQVAFATLDQFVAISNGNLVPVEGGFERERWNDTCAVVGLSTACTGCWVIPFLCAHVAYPFIGESAVFGVRGKSFQSGTDARRVAITSINRAALLDVSGATTHILIVFVNVTSKNTWLIEHGWRPKFEADQQCPFWVPNVLSKTTEEANLLPIMRQILGLEVEKSGGYRECGAGCCLYAWEKLCSLYDTCGAAQMAMAIMAELVCRAHVAPTSNMDEEVVPWPSEEVNRSTNNAFGSNDTENDSFGFTHHNDNNTNENAVPMGVSSDVGCGEPPWLAFNLSEATYSPEVTKHCPTFTCFSSEMGKDWKARDQMAGRYNMLAFEDLNIVDGKVNRLAVCSGLIPIAYLNHAPALSFASRWFKSSGAWRETAAFQQEFHKEFIVLRQYLSSDGHCYRVPEAHALYRVAVACGLLNVKRVGRSFSSVKAVQECICAIASIIGAAAGAECMHCGIHVNEIAGWEKTCRELVDVEHILRRQIGGPFRECSNWIDLLGSPVVSRIHDKYWSILIWPLVGSAICTTHLVAWEQRSILENFGVICDPLTNGLECSIIERVITGKEFVTGLHGTNFKWYALGQASECLNLRDQMPWMAFVDPKSGRWIKMVVPFRYDMNAHAILKAECDPRKIQASWYYKEPFFNSYVCYDYRSWKGYRHYNMKVAVLDAVPGQGNWTKCIQGNVQLSAPLVTAVPLGLSRLAKAVGGTLADAFMEMVYAEQRQRAAMGEKKATTSSEMVEENVD